jgi:hypothetical protein
MASSLFRLLVSQQRIDAVADDFHVPTYFSRITPAKPGRCRVKRGSGAKTGTAVGSTARDPAGRKDDPVRRPYFGRHLTYIEQATSVETIHGSAASPPPGALPEIGGRWLTLRGCRGSMERKGASRALDFRACAHGI